MESKPDMKDYNLDDEKIAFFKKINEQMEKEGGVFLFALSFSIVATLAFIIYFSIKDPTIFDEEGGVIKSSLILWWCLFCGVFAIGVIPVVNYILAPFLILYQIIYRQLNLLFNAPKKKRYFAKIYESQYNRYFSDLTSYERKIEGEKRVMEAELKKIAEEERARIKQEKLKERNFWLSMSGYTFEKEIESLYKKKGYIVNRTKYSGDGGIDMIMYDQNKNKIIVQCKNHKHQIGPNIVRELYGVMIAEKASKAILIGSGGFTKGVYAFSRNKSIELLDIDSVIELHEQLG